MAPSGIEPATFRLVVQCLNQLRHRVIHDFMGIIAGDDFHCLRIYDIEFTCVSSY